MTQQYSEGNGRSGSNLPGNAIFLLAGGLIGASVALLFAPKAGAALRGDIADVTKRGYDGACDLTHKVKGQATDLYHTVVEKGGGLVENARGTLAAAKGKVDHASDELQGTAGDLLSLPTEESEKLGATRSTDIH